MLAARTRPLEADWCHSVAYTSAFLAPVVFSSSSILTVIVGAIISRAMHAELSVAVNFVISHLYNKLPRRRVDVFREELHRGFELRFAGHWYPDDPTKGSGFRCVKLAADKVYVLFVAPRFCLKNLLLLPSFTARSKETRGLKN